MHNKMPTKLSPEIVFFNQAQRSKDDLIVKVGINTGSPRVWLIVGLSPGWIKTKTIELVFVASPLSTQL
jgi:hypothetical protein